MRLLPLVLLAACSLQGCATLIGSGVVADTNRQRRTTARTTGAELADRPPASGDTLTLFLANGNTLRGAVTGVTPGSLALDVGTFALTDVRRVERPWKRAEFGTTLVVAGLVDAGILWLVLRSLTFSGPGGGGGFF